LAIGIVHRLRIAVAFMFMTYVDTDMGGLLIGLFSNVNLKID
jgi:hypothetical protein